MEKKLLKNEFDFYKWYFEACSNNEYQLYPGGESAPNTYPVIVIATEDYDNYCGDTYFKYSFVYISDFDTNLK